MLSENNASCSVILVECLLITMLIGNNASCEKQLEQCILLRTMLVENNATLTMLGVKHCIFFKNNASIKQCFFNNASC